VEITPKTPERPATPPAPTIHLGDLKATQMTNGWGEPVPNTSIGGGPLLIDGKTYAKGIGAHANAISVYPIPEKATRFVAVVGIDDSQKKDPRSSVVFQVFGDVKEMGEKPVLIAESPALCDKSLRSWAFNLELSTRFKELHLVVTDAGDGNAADHADWVDAGSITGTEK
jgi:alpha-galactosidase